MNYCTRCGTRVSGKFCTVCGQRTSAPDAPGDATTIVTENARENATAVTTTNPPSNLDKTGPQPSPFASPDHETSEAHDDGTTGALSGPSTSAPTSRRFRWKSTPPAGVVLPDGLARRSVVLETRFVMIAFLVPVVINAVLVLAQQQSGAGSSTRFATIVHHNPLENMLLGMLGYLPVAAVVPLALYLLARTGQNRHVLGLEAPRFDRDVVPAIGLGLAAFGVEIVMLAPFLGFLNTHKGFVNTVTVGHDPKYYLIEGIFISAVTAITEEVIVNGYLITRLGQLGWTNQGSLVLSLALRTSYHIYYGWGFLLTVPLGYFVTRSFQKHHKLTRPIVTHFLYDAILITISILK